jgi:Arc/MetJ-type ribon-helix-helix transcriptional regulator
VTAGAISDTLEKVLGVLPMSLQLTPEQEQRIRTVVNAGAYRSAKEALDAAVAAVEIAAAPDFEGSLDELEKLLRGSLNSGEPVEADESFWSRLKVETDSIAAEHLARKCQT